MLNDTWPQYLSIRAIILLLQSLGPSCLLYTAWNIYTRWPSWPITTSFQTWCLAESLFLLFFLWFRTHLQREAVHPPARSREDRKALFTKVCSEIHNPQQFLSGWFRGAKLEEIGRDDLKLFLDWAFWDGRAQMQPGDVDEEELEEYMVKVERMMGTKFTPGHGTAKCLRLTLDPIEMECRTLFWYTLIAIVDLATHILMRRNGFQYFKTTSTSLPVLPLRPATAMESAQSPARDMSYWLRPHTSKTRLPVVWIHGIGVGLITQQQFLQELDTALNTGEKTDGEKTDGEVGILAIEVLQVSSRITHPILRREEFLQQFTEVLDFHHFDRFVLASHSYGSVLNTHILTHDPLASRISANLLVDPVTVLLHMPDVAYNFTVRPPKHANEWQLWYFASKDPSVAHTLGRHFFWSENCLWRDRITELVNNGMRITASLASHDLIVDTEAAGTYLTEHGLPDPVLTKDDEGREQMLLQTRSRTHWKHWPWQGQGLEVVWWEGHDHGQVFDKLETRRKLVDVLAEYSKGR